MARSQSRTLTEGEQRVMGALWRLGPSSVRELRADIVRQGPIAYTTVQTVLTVLARKGYVAVDASGPSHRYAPLVSQQEARATALQEVVRQFFGGSRRDLALHLLEAGELSEATLRELEARIGGASDD